jgi:hypothetical protein
VAPAAASSSAAATVAAPAADAALPKTVIDDLKKKRAQNAQKMKALIVPFAVVFLLLVLYVASRDNSAWAPGWLQWFLSRKWLVCTTGIATFLALLGVAKFGRPGGILITQLNVMSLSRLQMATWTTLVLGFYAAAVFARLAAGKSTDALSVAISGEIWGLLGISSAALVGSPLLLSFRRDKTTVAKTAVVDETAAKLQEKPADVMNNAQGPLYANARPEDARLSDIFEGDELANTYMVDLAKVQMFVFTAVCALVWVISSIRFLASGDVLLDKAALPALPEGMVTLLGVSNAGYLANKLVDHTRTQ